MSFKTKNFENFQIETCFDEVCNLLSIPNSKSGKSRFKNLPLLALVVLSQQ